MTRTPARRSVALVVLLALVAALCGAAVSWVLGAQGGSGPSSPPAGRASEAGGPVVKTTLPGLAAPTGEPMLPSVAAAHPAPGTVVRAKGPFDDRFTLGRLRLDRSRMSGVLTVTSEVTDLLALQVLVGFYDSGGRLLGTGRYVQSGTENDDDRGGAPSEVARFSVSVPRALRERVVSAAVGVPVLVNE